MTPVIWQDRLCFIEKDGSWTCSAVGLYTDFDFDSNTKDAAVSGSLPEFHPPPQPGFFVHAKPRITKNLVVIDDQRLLLVGTDDTFWLLTGNPCDGGRIEQLLQRSEIGSLGFD